MTDKIIIVEKSKRGIEIIECNDINEYIKDRKLDSFDRDENGYYRFKYYKTLDERFRVIKGKEMDLYNLTTHIEYGVKKKE